MARDTDVGGRSIGGLWRAPLAGGRSLDGWLDERTEPLLHAIAQRPGRPAIILLQAEGHHERPARRRGAAGREPPQEEPT